jgi:hypothetical protein
MTLSKTQKTISFILSVLALTSAIATFWVKCDMPIPATEQDITTVTEEQATIAIDVYSQQERDLRREELDLRERIQQQERQATARPDDTIALPPEELEYQHLLKETLEDTQEEKVEVQKKRTYYEEKALDLKKGK